MFMFVILICNMNHLDCYVSRLWS